MDGWSHSQPGNEISCYNALIKLGHVRSVVGFGVCIVG